MNTQINPRTFTDLIPAYREKTAFLKELGRQDLSDIHEYFFYKRMLIFYNDLKKSESPDKEEYMKKITDVINEGLLNNTEDFNRIYACSAASPNERRKMTIFLKYPKLYWSAIELNEELILPIKMMFRRRNGGNL